MGIGPTVKEKDIPCLKEIWRLQKKINDMQKELWALKDKIVKIR